MSNKQFLAQMGVFTLLGLNVAAYYFFWPSNEGRSANDVKQPTVQKKSAPTETEEQEIAVFANTKKSEPTSLTETVPILLPELPELPVPQPVPSKETISKGKEPLVDAVPFDVTGPVLPKDDVPPGNLPVPLLVLPKDDLPLPQGLPPQEDHVVKELQKQIQQVQSQDVKLPELQKQIQQVQSQDVNLPAPGFPPLLTKAVVENKKPVSPEPAGAPELNTKAAQSPWLLNVEMVGLRTQLIAQLRQKTGEHSLARFEILCDRLEMKAPGGTLQAIGNVTFSGAGLKGKCNRLTLPFGETRIVFEESVEVVHALKKTAFFWIPLKPGGSELEHVVSPGGTLRGEKITWELPPTPAVPEAKTTEVRRAIFDIPPDAAFPLLPTAPILGGPK